MPLHLQLPLPLQLQHNLQQQYQVKQLQQMRQLHQVKQLLHLCNAEEPSRLGLGSHIQIQYRPQGQRKQLLLRGVAAPPQVLRRTP